MPIVAARRVATSRTADQVGGKRRSRGSTAVYEDLREDILSMQLAPGSALDEVALAHRFGLSRTPIREALLMLSGEQLVTFMPSRSAIVAPHAMQNTPEYLDALVLHARAIARLSAQELAPDSLRAIEAAAAGYAEAVEDLSAIDRIVAADLAFHNAVADAARNQFLGNFYGLTLDYGRRMMLLHYYPRFGRAEARETISEHKALVDAVAASDGDLAEKLATRHIHAAVHVIQRSIEPKLSSSVPLVLEFASGGLRR